MDVTEEKINLRKINIIRFFKKGSGEYITFMISVVGIIALLIIIMGVIQLSACKASLSNALTATSRSVAMCTSLEDANDRAQLIADSAITTSNIENVRGWVTMTSETPEWGSGSYAVVHVSGKIKTISGFASGRVERKALVAVEMVNTGEEAGEDLTIPPGLGSVHSYMAWQLLTRAGTDQLRFRMDTGMPFNDEGFGIVNGRYVIACTDTFGGVGDYIDFYQEDGLVIPCVIGDIKNQNDSGCNEWGHLNGRCIVEFVVDRSMWYGRGHANPGTPQCHPEWNKNIVKAQKMGSYYN